MTVLLGCLLFSIANAGDLVPSLVVLSDGTNPICHTINEAVNYVAENGTVQVINGTWCEYVRVRKSVSIISLNSSRFGVVIDGKYRNYPDSPYQLSITASNVTVAGFTFRVTQIPPQGIGIHVQDCENIVIANCTFEDSTCIGIELVRVSNAIIFNNNISSKEFSIIMVQCTNIRFSYNTIRNADQQVNFYDSRAIVFHHNNVFRDQYYHRVSNTTCVWDDGLLHGNYWSDYRTRYPNATLIEGFEGLDAVWDTPYQIDPDDVDGMEHFDMYPLLFDPHVPSWTSPIPLNRRIKPI